MDSILKRLLLSVVALLMCCVEMGAMDTLISSYEVPAYQVVLKGPLSKLCDHVISVRCFNDKLFTCTQDELNELRSMKYFLKNSDNYVQTYDFTSVEQVKRFQMQLERQGYEVLYYFKARPLGSRL